MKQIKVYFCNLKDEVLFKIKILIMSFIKVILISVGLISVGLICNSCNTCVHLTHKINQETNNVKNGLWILKNDSNGIISIKYYKNNLLMGKYLEYFDNGNLRTIGKYSNGKEVGVWKYYSPNGILTLKRKYRKGKIIVNTIYNISWGSE
ncbi:MAG: toxin-antitoxin system YwqK family antitoxin [Bacteroidales bacterium]